MTAASAAEPIFFDQVQKTFGPVRALWPTTLEVAAGEFLTLLGPSGSGKTTLLNIAAGYLEPGSGRIRIGNRDVTGLPPRQRNIGMVFQNYALFPHMNVVDNVAYGLRVRSIASAEIARRVGHALAMVKLEGFEQRWPQQLSGGQQQRVALARAMVIEPDLLLMDEPLGALDRQLRKHVQLEIRRLHTLSRRTTIYVTHDQEEALVMSDRIAIMNEGRLEQIGTPVELYRSPKNVFVATFLGESNLLPVKIADRAGNQVSLRIAGADLTWQMMAHENLPPGPAAVLLVRPEDLQLAGAQEDGIAAEIAEVVYLGELTALRAVLVGGREVWLRRMKLPTVRVGERVRIRWDPESARLLDTTEET